MITDQEKAELERRASAPTVAKRDSERAEIILLRARGVKQEEVASRLSCSSVEVAKWTSRFRGEGLDGLHDKPGRGRKSSLKPEQVEKVVTEVNRPPEGRERWSVRSMAEAAEVSHSTVQRIWKANDLKPHRMEVFKVSNDPHFEEKFWDVIERRNGEHMQKHGTNRIELHFTPTSSSWMNLLERFFGDLSQQAVCNGNFQSVRELARRIEAYIAERDLKPKRHVWRAEGAEILAKIKRAREKLEKTD